MPATTLRGVIVGGGSIGRRHLQNLRALDVETAVVDPESDVRAEVSSEGDVRVFASLAAALDAEDPDCVAVCTPNSTHVDIATEAARAGCHLFIEKPLSHDMTGVNNLVSLVKEHGLVTLIGCNLRFHPEMQKIRALLKEGVVGDVVAARIEGGSYLPEWFPDSDYTDAYSARKDLGGGVILDYIHEINYARWFFGEFNRVTAMAGQRSDLSIETNDVAAIVAETASGALCEFHLDYLQREYSRSCHVVGETGIVRWSWGNGVTWSSADGQEGSFICPNDWEPNDMYVAEIEHFLDQVQDGTATTCPVSVGRRDVKLALAARESARTETHIDLVD